MAHQDRHRQPSDPQAVFPQRGATVRRDQPSRHHPGRGFVAPDDVKAVAVPALGHRLSLEPELWVSDVTGDDIVRRCLETVPTPTTLPE
jgi:MoxR-like ATPase